MTHVITELCLRDGGCLVVCPVNCIVAGSPVEQWPLYYIDPEVCIDCGACIPECPYGAIFQLHDVPENYVAFNSIYLSKPWGSCPQGKRIEVPTYDGQEAVIPAAIQYKPGELIDLRPAISLNKNFFVVGPGYQS